MPNPPGAILLCLAAVGAGCASRPGFVGTSEAPTTRIELRDGMVYDEAWEKVHLVLQGQATISFSSKEEGILESAWRTQRSYRSRAVISFAKDRRVLHVRTPAEVGKREPKKRGYDHLLLDSLEDGLRAAVGRVPQDAERPDLPAPRPSQPEVISESARARFVPHVDLWWLSFDGRARASERSARGSWIDFDDGGIDDRDMSPFFRMELTAPVARGLYAGGALGYWGVRGSGSDALQSDEVIGGETFPAGTSVDAEFRFSLLELAAVIERPATEESPWGWAATPGFQFYRSRFDLESSVEGESGRFNTFAFGAGFRGEWHPVPQLFLSGSLAAHLALIGTVTQAEVATGAAVGPVKVEAGFRWFFLDHEGSITRSRESLRFSAAGPFAGLTLTF